VLCPRAIALQMSRGAFLRAPSDVALALRDSLKMITVRRIFYSSRSDPQENPT
jgi:hypothetical protein